jgi:hypothetical protein
MKNPAFKKKFRIIKIILFNAIPILGFAFLDWRLFEIAVAYILQTFVPFIIFFVDYHFFDKKNRYPFVFALIQLFFLLIPFIGMMFAYGIVIFTITDNNFSFVKSANTFERMLRRVDDMDLNYLLLVFFIVETIGYLIKRAADQHHKESKIWYNIRKILFVHVYIISFIALLLIFPDFLLFQVLFIVGFKILFDFAIEDETFLDEVKKFFTPKKRKKREQ